LISIQQRATTVILTLNNYARHSELLTPNSSRLILW